MSRAATERVAGWLLTALYACAGVLHLVRPDPFIRIVPEFFPRPDLIVGATGVAEILGAIGLQIPRFRRAAGLGLALYALCVWPANFRHAIGGLDIAGIPTTWWYHGPRLALQPVLIGAALLAGGWFRTDRGGHADSSEACGTGWRT